MARIRVILKAVWRAFRREQKSVASLAANNIQYFAFALLFLGDPLAVVFFFVLVGVVLILPQSADPLATIPKSRLASWPLEKREMRILRLLSPWLNPVSWLLVALAFWKRVAVSLWLLIASPMLIRWIVPASLFRNHSRLWRFVPRPPGTVGLLFRKDLRQMLSTLDFWVGMVIAVPALIWRVAGLLPGDAVLPLTLLVILAISTCAQSLFGLDGESGMTRYRLLPLRGWQMLAAKDAAFLATAVLLSLPLSPLCASAGALTALAVGHGGTVVRRRVEARWRFQTSPSFGASAVQMVLMIAGGSAAYWKPPVLGLCAGAYVWSTWYFGRLLDQAA